MKKKSISKRTRYINNLFSRCLISVIFVLTSVIFVKYSANNLLMYKEHVFEKNFKFAKVRTLYDKYLGNILPFDKVKIEDEKTVFNEKFEFKESSKNYDGTKFVVPTNYLMPALHSGIVVFIGQKDNYGQTIIIQGTDGTDIWYTNINTSLKLYDYVQKGALVGEVIKDEITLVFQKDNKYIEYAEYEKNTEG